MNMDYLVSAFERLLNSYKINHILTNNRNKTEYMLVMKDLPNNIDSTLLSKDIDIIVNDDENKPVHKSIPLCQYDTKCNAGIIKIILTRDTFCQKMSIVEEVLRKELRKKIRNGNYPFLIFLYCKHQRLFTICSRYMSFIKFLNNIISSTSFIC